MAGTKHRDPTEQALPLSAGVTGSLQEAGAVSGGGRRGIAEEDLIPEMS